MLELLVSIRRARRWKRCGEAGNTWRRALEDFRRRFRWPKMARLWHLCGNPMRRHRKYGRGRWASGSRLRGGMQALHASGETQRVLSGKMAGTKGRGGCYIRRVLIPVK